MTRQTHLILAPIAARKRDLPFRFEAIVVDRTFSELTRARNCGLVERLWNGGAVDIVEAFPRLGEDHRLYLNLFFRESGGRATKPKGVFLNCDPNICLPYAYTARNADVPLYAFDSRINLYRRIR